MSKSKEIKKVKVIYKGSQPTSINLSDGEGLRLVPGTNYIKPEKIKDECFIKVESKNSKIVIVERNSSTSSSKTENKKKEE